MKPKTSLSFDERTIISYPELLAQDDLPEGAREAAPMPPESSDNLKEQDLEAYVNAIWDWAGEFDGVHKRLNDYVEGLLSDTTETIRQRLTRCRRDIQESFGHLRLGGPPGADLPDDDSGREGLIQNAIDTARDTVSSFSTS